MLGPVAPRFLKDTAAIAAAAAAAVEKSKTTQKPTMQSLETKKSSGKCKRKHSSENLQSDQRITTDVHVNAMTTPLDSDNDRTAPLVIRPELNSPDTIRSVIVGYSNSCLRYVSGCCYITLLKGSASINGYHLIPGKRTEQPFHFPSWLPAARLQVIDSSYASRSVPSTNKKLRSGKTLSDLIQPISNAQFPEVPMEPYDTLVLIEGVPLDQQEWMVAADDQRIYREWSDDADGETYIRIGSAVLGSASGLASLAIDVTLIPNDWRNAANGIIASPLPPRAIICGAKGVGKSTCLRYTLNRLLQHSEAVFVLDCDIGQPEFTVPGMVSLVLCTSPSLSPSYLNMQYPLLSFNFGDLTTKHEPDALIRAVAALMERYKSLCSEYVANHSKQLVVGTGTDVIRANAFEVLGDDDSSIDVRIPNTKGNIPLIINSDGFVRFMGAEVLTAIFDLVVPTHVMHISTDKDRFLPAVERARMNDQIVVSSIAPGRLTASKIAPTDLRTLRYVSHFLRNSEYLNATVQASRRLDEEGGVLIRNGALSDKKGAIAYALMGESAYAIPFESVFLQSLSSCVVPRLQLAAFNASIVAITASRTPPDHTIAHLKAQEQSSTTNDASFVIKIASSRALDDLVPCIGIGVVRAIDHLQKKLYLITPLDSNALLAEQNVRLVRGLIGLPNVMVYAPNFPCHPYQSGECAGEGGNLMKARTNVKRRSQQQK